MLEMNSMATPCSELEVTICDFQIIGDFSPYTPLCHMSLTLRKRNRDMIIEISQLAIICTICLAIGAIGGILISNFNRRREVKEIN